MGRMLSGRKVSEGARVSMRIEHTRNNPSCLQQPSVDSGNVAVVDGVQN